MGNIDINQRQPIGIGTIPAGPFSINSTSGATAAANSRFSFRVTTAPSDSSLTLWDFLFSIVIDSLALDVNGQYANLYPAGSAFTSGSPQLNTRITQWVDWASSNDQTNTRVHFIHIENFDSSPHTYYLFYKGYTFSTVPGRVS